VLRDVEHQHPFLFKKEKNFMRINFYDTRLSEDSRTILVKEKAINYQASNIDTCSPKILKDLMNTVVHLNVLGEEHLYMLALNHKAKLLGIFFISKGTVSQTCLNPRELFMRALMVGASCIVICHNHPSQNITPSGQDVITTQKVKGAGELLDIPLIDHIIIGGDDYYSFSEKGLL